MRVAAFTGLRLGELLALRWGDVDWSGSALTVQPRDECGHRGTDQVRPRLPGAARRSGNGCTRPPLAAGDFTSDDDLVFCNAIGRGIDGSALRRRFKRACAAAGLRPLRWHDLRHTFGSLLVAGGVDVVTVQSAMGHARLRRRRATCTRGQRPRRRAGSHPYLAPPQRP